eukprot:1006005_1
MSLNITPAILADLNAYYTTNQNYACFNAFQHPQFVYSVAAPPISSATPPAIPNAFLINNSNSNRLNRAAATSPAPIDDTYTNHTAYHAVTSPAADIWTNNTAYHAVGPQVGNTWTNNPAYHAVAPQVDDTWTNNTAYHAVPPQVDDTWTNNTAYHAVTSPAADINPIYNNPSITPAQMLQLLRKDAPAPIPTTIDAPSDGFKCDQCDHVFVRKVNLTVHKKVHTDLASVCQFCNKKFARKSNLQQHIRIHTNERPYHCTHCPRTFRQQHSLKAHLRTHTGEKPHQCIHCKKRFSAKCNLTVHLRTHTGDKPYQCVPCNKRYASKSGYNAHMRKFHVQMINDARIRR